jgi:hypothetical protein
VNPPFLMFGENGRVIRFENAAMAHNDYTSDDVTVRVTALPLHGTVLRQDGVAQIHLGQTVTVGELAALRFKPATAHSEFASGPQIEPAWNGLVLYAAQSSEPTPIRIRTPNGSGRSAADLRVTITELPSELGLKFQASSNATITGLRLYKGPQNTGRHVADLWSSGTAAEVFPDQQFNSTSYGVDVLFKPQLAA